MYVICLYFIYMINIKFLFVIVLKLKLHINISSNKKFNCLLSVNNKFFVNIDLWFLKKYWFFYIILLIVPIGILLTVYIELLI